MWSIMIYLWQRHLLYAFIYMKEKQFEVYLCSFWISKIIQSSINLDFVGWLGIYDQ